MTLIAGTQVAVLAAGITGLVVTRAATDSSWWNNDLNLDFELVAIEDAATGEVRFFRSDVVTKLS